MKERQADKAKMFYYTVDESQNLYELVSIKAKFDDYTLKFKIYAYLLKKKVKHDFINPKFPDCEITKETKEVLLLHKVTKGEIIERLAKTIVRIDSSNSLGLPSDSLYQAFLLYLETNKKLKAEFNKVLLKGKQVNSHLGVGGNKNGVQITTEGHVKFLVDWPNSDEESILYDN